VRHAKPLYELAVAAARNLPLQFGPFGFGVLGPNSLLAGQLALLMNELELARGHLEEALELSARLRSTPFIAQTELALAEVSSREGSSDEASAHARRARELALKLGLETLARKAAALAGATSPAPAPEPRAAPPAERSLLLERQGELWALGDGAKKLMLKDGRGLAYLEALMRSPHREVHVLELVGADDVGDAGPMLDDRAKTEYRGRLRELQAELDEATEHGDLGRAERAREELDAIAGELARGLGLGGRDRKAGSAAERARINVQRRLRDVTKRVTEQDAELGRHLELSVKTGLFCIYAPTWPRS